MFASKAVVFVIDKYSEPVHINKLICGVKHPSDNSTFFSLLADLANILPGTKVFFYKRRIDEEQRQRGFIGKFEALSEAFRDPNIVGYGGSKIYGICPNCKNFSNDEISKSNNTITIKCKNCGATIDGHLLPLRVKIKYTEFYNRYLDDNTAYIDITDEGRLSTLIFRKIYGKGRERSVTPILPEEAEKLERLLSRVQNEQRNEEVLNGDVNFDSYEPDWSKIESLESFINKIVCGQNGEILYESMLEFYIIYALGHPNNTLFQDIKNIFTPFNNIEWYGNQILFGIGGDKSDIVVTYKDKDGYRYKADIVELKKGTIDERACIQAYQYIYWIAQLITGNIQNRAKNPFKIKPIVIGHSLKRNFNFSLLRQYLNKPNPFLSIPYPFNTLDIELEPLEIWTYKCKHLNGRIRVFFTKVSIDDYSNGSSPTPLFQ